MNYARRIDLPTLAVILLGLICLVLQPGCVSASSATADAGLLQGVLDKVLPADFNGPAHVSHRNAYFDITIDAGGLHRTEKGWTWTWLTYERNSHFPIWSSSGVVTLGTKP